MDGKKLSIKLDNLEVKTDKEIEELVKTTEKVLSALKKELRNRKEHVQHQGIDELESHLEQADTSFKALSHFIHMAISELKK